MHSFRNEWLATKLKQNDQLSRPFFFYVRVSSRFNPFFLYTGADADLNRTTRPDSQPVVKLVCTYCSLCTKKLILKQLPHQTERTHFVLYFFIDIDNRSSISDCRGLLTAPTQTHNN